MRRHLMRDSKKIEEMHAEAGDIVTSPQGSLNLIFTPLLLNKTERDPKPEHDPDLQF